MNRKEELRKGFKRNKELVEKHCIEEHDPCILQILEENELLITDVKYLSTESSELTFALKLMVVSMKEMEYCKGTWE